MKRIVIGDNGRNHRLRGAEGKAVWIERKAAPAGVGETVRVAWKDDYGVEEGGEYVVSAIEPSPHGTRETWSLVCLVRKAEGGAKCIDGLRGNPDCRGCDEHCLDVRKRNCFFWNPDIGKCALDGKPSCRIACDDFTIATKAAAKAEESEAENE